MQDWARRVAEGDVRALARAATGIENREPAALALLRELEPRTGKATILGITGPPGAGKSTLVDALAAALRKKGRTVGILAVDPSSRISGGAILGDRIRMQQHYGDSGIFIRSMATRGSMGGLARAAAGVVRLLDAAGKDFIVIETVGVGQDEVEIAELAQVTAVVLVPGMGDDVQAIKAGIMEIADIFVINKADYPGAAQVEREVKAMLGLANRPDGWVPPIVHTVATEGVGIEELLDAVERYRSAARTGRQDRARRLSAAANSLDHALRSFVDETGIEGAVDSIVLRVPDLNSALERLRSHGAAITDDARRARAIIGGVALELIEEKHS